MFLAAFRDHVGRSVPIYTDPDLLTYKAMALSRNVVGSLDIRTLFRGIKAYGAGHRQGATKGDVLQLGGVFWIDTSGIIRYAYRSQYAGDHPSISSVIDALSA